MPAERETAAARELALLNPEPFNDDMFGVTTSDDYQPVAWMGRYPVHVTTLLVMVHVVCMILSCLLIAIGVGGGILLLIIIAFVVRSKMRSE